MSEAEETMHKINRTWLEGKVDDLAPMLHPDITMAIPGFAGSVQGREAFLTGFRDFCENAKVHEYHEHAYHVDVAGETAVVTYPYEMVYERDGARYRSTGRDLWVFQSEAGKWIAVWRTMLDIQDEPAGIPLE